MSSRIARSAAVVLVAAGGLLVPTAHAAPMPVPLRARVSLHLADQLLFTTGPFVGSGVADPDAGTLQVPGGLLALSGLVVPLVDFPLTGITRLTVSAANATGTFAYAGAGSTFFCPGPAACLKGGGFGGALAFVGSVALGGAASATLPIGVVGTGGTTSAPGVTLRGAPWTLRTAAVATGGTSFTRMGTGAPFASGLRVVTPVLVNLGPDLAHLPLFLELRLVPEPAPILVVLAAAAAWLGYRGRGRRIR